MMPTTREQMALRLRNLERDNRMLKDYIRHMEQKGVITAQREPPRNSVKRGAALTVL